LPTENSKPQTQVQRQTQGASWSQDSKRKNPPSAALPKSQAFHPSLRVLLQGPQGASCVGPYCTQARVQDRQRQGVILRAEPSSRRLVVQFEDGEIVMYSL
jgi:hypothetical protein